MQPLQWQPSADPPECPQVVDEADRLLRQAYHGWLGALRAVLLPRAGAAPRRVLQILVSATLTHDPSKLSRFKLHSPRCGPHDPHHHQPAAACAAGYEPDAHAPAARDTPVLPCVLAQ